MSILVTGGTGLVGSNVARLLIEQGRDVVVYDRQPPPKEHSVLAGVMQHVKMEIGNVTDLAHVLSVIKRNDVKGIIHLGAMIGVTTPECPIEALQVNIIGSANMLEVARILKLRRVVVASSAAVFGSIKELTKPAKEEDIVLPLAGIYALSKLTCEQLTYTYRQLYRVDAVAIRLRGVYGPGQDNRRPIQPIDLVVSNAVARNSIRYETGGDTTSSFTYVKDAAKGIILAYDCKTPGYHVYNISSGRNRKMSEVCEVVRGLFPSLPIEIGPGLWPGTIGGGEQTDNIHRLAQRPPLDISRARKDLGFEPEWDIERAIPDWIRWLKEEKY